VDIVNGVVEVYYERELRARFIQATGEELGLDEEYVADEIDEAVQSVES
jgi:hypothetical protein